MSPPPPYVLLLVHEDVIKDMLTKCCFVKQSLESALQEQNSAAFQSPQHTRASASPRAGLSFPGVGESPAVTVSDLSPSTPSRSPPSMENSPADIYPRPLPTPTRPLDLAQCPQPVQSSQMSPPFAAPETTVLPAPTQAAHAPENQQQASSPGPTASEAANAPHSARANAVELLQSLLIKAAFTQQQLTAPHPTVAGTNAATVPSHQALHTLLLQDPHDPSRRYQDHPKQLHLPYRHASIPGLAPGLHTQPHHSTSSGRPANASPHRSSSPDIAGACATAAAPAYGTSLRPKAPPHSKSYNCPSVHRKSLRQANSRCPAPQQHVWPRFRQPAIRYKKSPTAWTRTPGSASDFNHGPTRTVSVPAYADSRRKSYGSLHLAEKQDLQTSRSVDSMDASPQSHADGFPDSTRAGSYVSSRACTYVSKGSRSWSEANTPDHFSHPQIYPAGPKQAIATAAQSPWASDFQSVGSVCSSAASSSSVRSPSKNTIGAPFALPERSEAAASTCPLCSASLPHPDSFSMSRISHQTGMPVSDVNPFKSITVRPDMVTPLKDRADLHQQQAFESLLTTQATSLPHFAPREQLLSALTSSASGDVPGQVSDYRLQSSPDPWVVSSLADMLDTPDDECSVGDPSSSLWACLLSLVLQLTLMQGAPPYCPPVCPRFPCAGTVDPELCLQGSSKPSPKVHPKLSSKATHKPTPKVTPTAISKAFRKKSTNPSAKLGSSVAQSAPHASATATQLVGSAPPARSSALKETSSCDVGPHQVATPVAVSTRGHSRIPSGVQAGDICDHDSSEVFTSCSNSNNSSEADAHLAATTEMSSGQADPILDNSAKKNLHASQPVSNCQVSATGNAAVSPASGLPSKEEEPSCRDFPLRKAQSQLSNVSIAHSQSSSSRSSYDSSASDSSVDTSSTSSDSA
eukprot:gene1992-3004_t